MNNELIQIYEQSRSKEKDFLMSFLYELTKVSRLISNTFEAEEELSGLKQINEINHRVLNRIRGLEGSDDFFDSEYLSDFLQVHVQQAPHIEGLITDAARRAKKCLTRS